MDGNGRWAKARGLPRSAGHAAGSETFKRVATYLNNIGIKYLTIYAFSTENWRRPKEEVSAIMSLLEKYTLEALDTMEKDNIRLFFWGTRDNLPDRIVSLIESAEEKSVKLTGMQVNVCLNYGGRLDIVNAVKKIVSDGNLSENDITEDVISDNLFSAGIPDPDLIIRPSGELRISNFLLWQSAYSEFYFTDRLWPDFGEKDINRALHDFENRKRRFGGV
jgi:undecaprenyl diphosphate synthase